MTKAAATSAATINYLLLKRITVPNKTTPLLICLLALSLTACNRSLPKMPDLPKLAIYKIDIAQGNIVEAEQISKLTVGMAKRHVQVLLGTPLIKDPFNAERWDYIYNYQPGGEARQQRQVTLFFDDQQLLARIAGDVVGQLRTTPLQISRAKTTIKVPAREIIQEQGFWHGMRKRIPFVGDKSDTEAVAAPVVASAAPASTIASSSPGHAGQTTALPTSINPIPASLDRPQPTPAAPVALASKTFQAEMVDSPKSLQPGMSLSEINNPGGQQPEQVEQPLDDDSGLFDGLLRKIGG